MLLQKEFQERLKNERHFFVESVVVCVYVQGGGIEGCCVSLILANPITLSMMQVFTNFTNLTLYYDLIKLSSFNFARKAIN